MRFAVATALLVASSSFAHGAYPLAYSLTERPGDPQQLIAGTTFGGLVSNNGGKTWSWVCEEAVGYGAMATPKWLMSESGAMFAAGFRGLHVSRDRGCTWNSTSDFDATGAADLAIDGSTLYACSGKYDALNRVMKSTDDGLTWSPIGPAPSKVVFYSAVKVAPSRPQRVYVSEWWFQPVSAALHISDDSGAHFERIDLTASLPTASAFTLLAIDPVDPDTLYASVTQSQNPDGGTPTSTFIKSTNGGHSFAPLFTATSQVSSATVSADRTTVFAATGDGLFRSIGGADFTQVKPPTRSACADQAPNSLYVCGWPEVDGFALARTDDRASSALSPILRWSQICGISSCPLTRRSPPSATPISPRCRPPFPPI